MAYLFLVTAVAAIQIGVVAVSQRVCIVVHRVETYATVTHLIVIVLSDTQTADLYNRGAQRGVVSGADCDPRALIVWVRTAPSNDLPPLCASMPRCF